MVPKQLSYMMALLSTLLIVPAAGGASRPSATGMTQAGSANGTITIKTFELSGEFKTPSQLQWIADGTEDGAIAFTDRAGNAVGVLDPTSGNTQRFPVNVITSPNPIVVIDQARFAIPGTGGVGIFDRSGTGTIRQLQMAGTRNTVLALGPDNKLFVADAQNNDVRIIEPPYSGPADITKFPLPPVCRGPTGLIPGASTITVLCGQTNNFVDLSLTGSLLRNVPLKTPNSGAQEARPTPGGVVYSGFNANQVTAWGSGYPDPYNFLNVLLQGPAVPTAGYFRDSAYFTKLDAGAKVLARGKRPPRTTFFNAFTPSYRGGGFSLATFRTGATPRSLTASNFVSSQRRGKNLVGSTIGPEGSIFVADATPGKPALHRVSFTDPKATRTRTGYRYKGYRLTATDPEFVQRMAMPFFGPGPFPRNTPPKEVQVGIVGASSSPWNLKATFSTNFDLKITVTGTIWSGGTYKPKVQTADTGPYTSVLRIFGFRPKTTGVKLTLTGKTTVPVTFEVNAQAVAPAPEPCECDSLEVGLNLRYVTSGRVVSFDLGWSMECTKGTGRCSGLLTAAITKSDRGKRVLLAVEAKSGKATVERGERVWRVDCGIECDSGVAASPQGNEDLTIFAPADGDFGKTVGSVTVEVDRFCRRELAPKIFRVAFNADGYISKGRSDLNGNGIPDGKEKQK